MIAARLALCLVLLAGYSAPAAVLAQDPSGTQQARPRPLPEIPPELRRLVEAPSRDRLVVRGLGGQAIPVDVQWYEAADFRLFPGERFVGIAIYGNETFGYLLVDRTGRAAAAVMETGDAPVFSPDGRHFAAAQISDPGWGNLEGVALWEVRPEGSVRRLFSDALPYGQDWRVDGWRRSDCVALSAVGSDWQPEPGRDWADAIREAPRVHYAIEIGSGVALRSTSEAQPCAEDQAP